MDRTGGPAENGADGAGRVPLVGTAQNSSSVSVHGSPQELRGGIGIFETSTMCKHYLRYDMRNMALIAVGPVGAVDLGDAEAPDRPVVDEAVLEEERDGILLAPGRFDFDAGEDGLGTIRACK